MATIQIKKPSNAASVTAPTASNLTGSEPAMVFGASPAQNNGGGRLYIGSHDGTAVHVIGGHYFTAMLDHAHGTLTASSGIITDSNNAIDTLNLGNHATAASQMKFLEGTNNGDKAIILKGTADVGAADVTITLPAVTGNVITSGDSGSIASGMIADTAVTLAKIQNVAANSLLIRNASSAGALTELAVADTKIIIGDGSGMVAAALSGDVTMSNAGAVTIAATAVTLAKIQNVAANSLLIRNASSAGALTELALATTEIMIGDGSGMVAAALSGDVTMSNAGAVAIGAQKITNAMMADDAVGADELAANAVVNASVASGAAIAMSKTAFVDGDGLTLSTNTLSVDADQSGQITAVANLTVGPGNANATISSDGAHNLILQTNAGTDSGLITITDAANQNIILAPDGTGKVDVDDSKIIGVADPTDAQDAATKAYVDAVKTGLDVKDSVRVATAAILPNSPTYAQATGIITAGSNVSINTAGIDGVTNLAVNDRVLVKNQAETRQNGIYYVSVVGTASGTPAPWTLTRATDADAPAELTGGTFTFCEDGSANSENGYVFTHDGTPTLTNGTLSNNTPLTVAQFSGAGQITAGTGLTKTGNTINAGGSTTIIAATNSLAVNSSGTAHEILRSGGTTETAATFGALALNQGAAITGTLPVGNGGTGATTFTQYGILLGAGTSAVGALTSGASGTAGYFLQAVSGGNPAWTETVSGGTF